MQLSYKNAEELIQKSTFLIFNDTQLVCRWKIERFNNFMDWEKMTMALLRVLMMIQYYHSMFWGVAFGNRIWPVD